MNNHPGFTKKSTGPAWTVLWMLLAVATAACTPKQAAVVTAEDRICESPRPRICTMDYVPVCAAMENGSWKTMSNACTACSFKEVRHYRPGPCLQE